MITLSKIISLIAGLGQSRRGTSWLLCPATRRESGATLARVETVASRPNPGMRRPCHALAADTLPHDGRGLASAQLPTVRSNPGNMRGASQARASGSARSLAARHSIAQLMDAL